MKKHLKKIVRKLDIQDKSEFDFVLNQSERITKLQFIDFNKFIQNLTQEDFMLYPNTENLKEKLSEFYEVNTDELFLCAGSDVGIKAVFETFTDGGRVVTTDPSFPMYKVYSELYQCEYFGIPHEENGHTISTEKILSNITDNTDLVILANPNSPMGEYKSFDEIEIILQQGVPVLIDEAYIEFVNDRNCENFSDTLVKKINEYPNLIVTRTFSKAFGAAGCRVGMVFSNKKNIELISKFRQMYEVSGVSAKYCEFLLDNYGLTQQYLLEVEREKEKVKYMLSHFDVIDSFANWIHFNTEDDNKKIKKILEDYNVLVKWCTIPHDDRKNWCRLTIAPGITDEEFFDEVRDAT